MIVFPNCVFIYQGIYSFALVKEKQLKAIIIIASSLTSFIGRVFSSPSSINTLQVFFEDVANLWEVCYIQLHGT